MLLNPSLPIALLPDHDISMPDTMADRLGLPRGLRGRAIYLALRDRAARLAAERTALRDAGHAAALARAHARLPEARRPQPIDPPDPTPDARRPCLAPHPHFATEANPDQPAETAEPNPLETLLAPLTPTATTPQPAYRGPDIPRRLLEPRHKRRLIRAALELPTPGAPPRLTPVRAWRPMTGEEWNALRPYVAQQGPGRPIQDPRTRLDLIFGVATGGLPWERTHDLATTGAPIGAPVRGNTLGRQFRRWTHAGLWKTLLLALMRTDCDPVLKSLEYWILRAARRAMRLMGAAGLALARVLGQLTALPLPPWMLPNPNLSERARDLQRAQQARGYTLREEPLRRLLHAIREACMRRRPWSRALAPA